MVPSEVVGRTQICKDGNMKPRWPGSHDMLCLQQRVSSIRVVPRTVLCAVIASFTRMIGIEDSCVALEHDISTCGAAGDCRPVVERRG
eukprot:5548439-Amphidinium_carterae.1